LRRLGVSKLKNWYFIYDASGFKKQDIVELTDSYEELGFKYNQCTELGAGPSPEQVVTWIGNVQIFSDISTGLLTSLIYDILKHSFMWFTSHKYTKKAIPVIEIFTRFKDKNISSSFKFRIDKKYNRTTLERIVRYETKFLQSVSNKDLECYICHEQIHSHCVFYYKNKDLNNSICIFCKDKLTKEVRNG